MAGDPGLGELTDDQLVELARGISEEITRRRRPVYVAAVVDDLGLADIDDDDLIDLAYAVTAETGRRGRGVYEAVLDATAAARVDAAAERDRATAAADRAWATQWSDWARAKRASLMIEETFGLGWRFAVWRSGRGERRVYLEKGDGRPPKVSSSDRVRAHHGRPPRRPPPVIPKVTYFVDGGDRAPPGHLELAGDAAAASPDRVAAIVRYIAACWDERGGLPIETALDTHIVAAPPPPYYS